MRFSRSDVAVFLFVGIFSSILFILFVSDVNRVAENKDGILLGSIVFQKNTATRRAENSMRWEHLRSDSSVYQGDTIRTSDVSELAVQFKNGTKLNVFENTMVRIDSAGDSQSFEILGGSMRLAGSGGKTAPARVILAGKAVIDISANSDVSLNSAGGTLSLDVSSGSATLVPEKGNVSKISENEALSLDTESGAATVSPRSIRAVSPSRDSRLITRNSKESVTFLANASGPVSGLVLEISSSPQFDTVARSVNVTAALDGSVSASLPVDAGSWFWRFRAESGEASATSRFTLALSRPPELVWPEDRTVLKYRNTLPPVRFSWSESPEAASYMLELSRDPRGITVERSVRTDLAGITIPDFPEGDWFWRVIPVFSGDVTGSVEPSQFRAISLERSESMHAVQPIVPADRALYEIKDAGAVAVSFSWQREAEAALYELTFYSSSDRGQALASYKTEKAWLSLSASEAPFLSKAGSYYWDVVWKDSEGTDSPPCPLRRIDGVDGRAAIRPMFPPDGYATADSLVSTIQFSWKSNLKTKMVFQVSPDASFKSIASEKVVSEDFVEGAECGAGLWFWRVVSLNADGSVFLASEARRVRVVRPFAAPVLRQPEPERIVSVVEGSSQVFSWSVVGGANYYSLKVYPLSENASSAPAFRKEYLESPECEVPLGTMEAGPYRVELQAFSRDSEAGTRIVGAPGSYRIIVRKIYPVTLVSPVENAVIDGIVARRKGVYLEWRQDKKPDSVSITVTRNDMLYPIRFSWKPGDTSFLLPNLPEGSYTWKVNAIVGGLNVSSRNQPSFTVRPIPLLPEPAAIAPADKTVFDYSYLESKHSIKFEWTPVKGATHYTLAIYADGGPVIFRAEKIPETFYVLGNLSCLDKGNFVWEVSAQNYWTDGKKDQDGQPCARNFSIVLPALAAPSPAGKKAEYYGY